VTLRHGGVRGVASRTGPSRAQRAASKGRGSLTCPRCGRVFSARLEAKHCPADGSPLTPSIDPRTGTRVGAYRVLGPLGRGSMGTVYRAEHVFLQKVVAMKVLHRQMLADSRVRQRFLVEARTASRLHHPNVVDVSDFGWTGDDCPYIVMELLEGQTLDAELEQEGAMAPMVVLPLVSQVCAAVTACHEQGIVHRDLKPENIVLLPPPDGLALGTTVDRVRPSASRRPRHRPQWVKVLDFGLASFHDLTRELDRDAEREELITGTPYYLSPEQAQGKTGDARSDIYSIGVILFELLTGELPFPGDTVAEVLRQHLEAPVPSMRRVRPDLRIPPEADQVVYRAMAKRPGDRFASAAELMEALGSCYRSVRDSVLGLGGAPARARTVAFGSGGARARQRSLGVWLQEQDAQGGQGQPQ